MEAELRGLYKGLQMPSDHGIRLIHVEVDNLGLLKS